MSILQSWLRTSMFHQRERNQEGKGWDHSIFGASDFKWRKWQNNIEHRDYSWKHVMKTEWHPTYLDLKKEFLDGALQLDIGMQVTTLQSYDFGNFLWLSLLFT